MKGQSGALLEHLKTKGSITSMEAIELYGATRLSARIYDFRKLGYAIETHDITAKNRFGETYTYAKYVFNGKEKAE